MKVREIVNRHPKLRHWRIGVVILLALFGAILCILAARWPFTQRATVRSLEQISLSDVNIGRFEKKFFPHPGYIAQEVTFTRGNAANTPPLASIDKLTCRASWFSLLSFTHRITRMDLEGLRIYIPTHLPPAIRKHPQAPIETTVTDLFANGAVLEIAPRHGGSQTERFDFPELALSSLARKKAVHFRTLTLNAKLIGQLKAIGSVGPLRLGQIAEAPLSGNYQIRDDLSKHKVVAGILSAEGQFNGTVGRAEVAGRAAISDFEIMSSRHSQGVTAEYRAVVNGVKGDIEIQSAEAHFLRTTLLAHGSMSGPESKTLSLDIEGRHARVEDLLRLAVKASQPPLDGALDMRVHVVLPSRRQPFLKRVQLRGSFSIAGAEFTNPATQEKLDELSARARGEKKPKPGTDSERITAELKSDVQTNGGVATLSEAVFLTPGAIARGAGTYNLLNEWIDLHGKLAIRATLSKAAGGIKSIALLPLDPFFKKKGAGAVIPVSITGTYAHPVFRVLFTK
jgi:hypothetical protein